MKDCDKCGKHMTAPCRWFEHKCSLDAPLEINKKLNEEINYLKECNICVVNTNHRLCAQVSENIEENKKLKSENDNLKGSIDFLNKENSHLDEEIKSLYKRNEELFGTNEILGNDLCIMAKENESLKANNLKLNAELFSMVENELPKPKFKVGDTVKYVGKFVPWVLGHGEIVQIHNLQNLDKNLIGVLVRNYAVHVHESDLELITTGENK